MGGCIKPLALGWIGGLWFGWMGGQREKVREVYGFSSLMKQNKKGKNCAVFCFAGKRKLLYLFLRCDYMGNFLKTAQYLLLPLTACSVISKALVESSRPTCCSTACRMDSSTSLTYLAMFNREKMFTSIEMFGTGELLKNSTRRCATGSEPVTCGQNKGTGVGVFCCTGSRMHCL
jgi:hypothetical protein